MNPTYPGSAFSTGAPEPGIYYIGIYNDHEASESIQDYTLQVSMRGVPGTLKSVRQATASSDCSVPCPGMDPSDVYSNSPTSSGTFCSGRGVWSAADVGACVEINRASTSSGSGDNIVDGVDACQDGCAADDEGNTCSNRGTCVDAGIRRVASCACDKG